MCTIRPHLFMEQLLQENNMGYHAPKNVVQKTPDPLINLAETGAEVEYQKNKRGMLSTFLQGSRNRTSGMIGQALNRTQPTLGSSNV